MIEFIFATVIFAMGALLGYELGRERGASDEYKKWVTASLRKSHERKNQVKSV